MVDVKLLLTHFAFQQQQPDWLARSQSYCTNFDPPNKSRSVFNTPRKSSNTEWFRVNRNLPTTQQLMRIVRFETASLACQTGRGEGRCLPGNLWYSPSTSMTSCLASVTFKMASNVFIEETDKNFHFITETLFRFPGFGDFKIPIVTENKTLVLFGNETSSGVRN